MNPQFEEIQKRMSHIGNLNNYLEDLLAKIPGNLLSGKQQEKLMDVLLDDKDLNKLLEGLKDPRPPRFVLVGRTGVGKSSLINAMSGRYLAEVSDVEIGTKEARRFTYESDGQVYFEVIDTRGIGESESFNQTAESELATVIKAFRPDAILFLQKATERAHIDKDVDSAKKMMLNAGYDLPMVGIITHVDELNPSRIKNPVDYPKGKLSLIEEKKAQLMRIFKEQDARVEAIIPVSSYIEWDRDADDLPQEKRRALTIEFDGRYGIEELLDFLEQSIDIRAAIHLGMTIRVNKIAEKIALRFIKVFSALAATVALSPIIATDIAVLLSLQTVLLMIVAYLSGRDLEFKTARELLVSLGGIGATGFTLRMIAQQGSKFANLVLPGAGSAISASIASGGTYAIGKAAVAYYLKGVPEGELKQVVKSAREEFVEIE
ncbi:MAG TPA: 50S ribosome-binding GTPase [Sporosarcina psychrophila]|uniref:50S ribosome-binding GTPase n=1 Tax=Sporosarcina psychrophila TaxID=1476 RepID=A0A921KFF8_SPOPS|nr:50S ribosome-binding GTPase [Sporosarcina psychrophila]